ncbi:MAG: hypothetical protein JWP69_587 [Flaviaesturariibacter sp.]|nr:hypothetical protein [Flaviaesturariibacter sp.]
MKSSLLILLLFLISCNPYKALRRDRFAYTEGGIIKSLDLRVPKGYDKKVETDAWGNQVQTYTYGNGASLYFLHLANDSSYRSIDTAFHIGQPQLYGGLFYKELDSSHRRFWREVFVKNFRFGYKKVVPETQEALLDSALNFVRVR